MYAVMTKAQLALEAKSPSSATGDHKRTSRSTGFGDLPRGVDPSAGQHGSTAPGQSSGGSGGHAGNGGKKGRTGNKRNGGGGGNGGHA